MLLCVQRQIVNSRGVIRMTKSFLIGLEWTHATQRLNWKLLLNLVLHLEQ